jgi:hypothetical protein
MKHLVLLVLLALAGSAPAQVAEIGNRWRAWQFLIGEWVGEGSGEPGRGVGDFSLEPDLQNAVLIRRSRAAYAALGNRPAFTHEDLMVIYAESGKPAAIYFDNEEHVIRYAVEFSADSTSVTFLSEPSAGKPRFRFAYVKGEDGVVTMSFDIAPPGKPEAFARYLTAAARRK